MAKLGSEMSHQLARQGGDAKFEMSPDDLDTIAASVAPLVHNVFLGKNALLVVTPSSEPCTIQASRAHLQRLFLNLFLNALSVSKEGGRVRLEIRRDGSSAVATIDDDGPGFSAEVLPRLFGAYETTRASQGGTGLGLNLCARIAREHGGSLSAENRPEGGARLILRLPLVAPK
jgi:signal transduction histidine kinase